jgi:hypothetical protein
MPAIAEAARSCRLTAAMWPTSSLDAAAEMARIANVNQCEAPNDLSVKLRLSDKVSSARSAIRRNGRRR